MKLSREEQSKGNDLLKELVSRAQENAAFKDALINNPEETIKSVNPNIEIPEGMTIQVADQTSDSVIYINIPQQVNLDNIELTDEQMELVSGGIALISLSAAAIVGLGALFVGSVGLGVVLYNQSQSEE